VSETPYLYGYSDSEQRRLVAQAEYWRELILRDLAWRAGERVLEIGCGAGAVLGVLARAFGGIAVAGIDREPRQIAFAQRHLAKLAEHANLRVGDAAALPWPDASFDHAMTMWFLEHLREPLPALREARRVLRPGGTITCTETDYSTFAVHPPSPDWDALARAQYQYFAGHGQPYAGRMLGAWLTQAGFADVHSAPVGCHFFHDGREAAALRAHVDYVAAFLEPYLDELAAATGADRGALQRGVDHLRRLPNDPLGATTQIVYRARARA
jgi:ubiquinone/menaquinone biosynthesis C-methylase UbiE